MAKANGEFLGVIVSCRLMLPSAGERWGKCWCSGVEECNELGSSC